MIRNQFLNFEVANSLASLFQIVGIEGVTALEKTTRFPDAPRTALNATQRVLGVEKFKVDRQTMFRVVGCPPA